MGKENYVAYVGTYTHQNSIGIHIYDVDVTGGVLTERKVVPISNPSDVVVSKSGKFLYSIADEGVEAFKILPDGDLEAINEKWIGGMRGCYVQVDAKDQYLFVGGYHDGRVTMMRLEEDGSIGEIADGIFHKGLGASIADRKNSRPHVTCVEVTPDQKYLCAVDCGLDHVKVYAIDYANGKLKLADILRCDIESAPRMIRFSQDGKFAYVLCELKNSVEVYKYSDEDNKALFEKVQTVSTLGPKDINDNSAACGIELSEDGTHLICTNAGIDTAVVYEVNKEDGTLQVVCNEPISGEYPKTLAIFPDGKRFVTLNHETNQMCVFKIDYQDRYFLREGRPVSIETPNSIYIHKLG